MALGTTVYFTIKFRRDVVGLASVSSNWVTILDAGAVDSTDNAGNDITNPTSQIATTDHHIITRDQAMGTVMKFRLVYDDALTVTVDPEIQVFGRTGSDMWEPLHSLSGLRVITLTADVSDVTDGTYLYTTPHPTNANIDCGGCDEILVGVKTALAGTGNAANATVQAKIV